ncbi:alpha/beta hydrolase [Corynebacterium mastitidis]|uniref:Alpha/beta hydrolase n=1 Tax=Corynebacterium mastitidis TaxID=161890 RepID=A0ABU8NZ99_9CORY
MRSQHVRLPFTEGSLDAPDRPQAYALMAHCFAGSRRNLATARISKRLAHYGIATLRFDFTSLLLSENIAELREAYGWMERHHAAPGLLVGHSLGGAAVLRSGLDAALATVGTPRDPHASILPYVSGDRAVIGGYPVGLPAGLLEDLAAHPPLRDLPGPLLVVHSPTDEIVPWGESLVPHASCISVEADHMLTAPGAAHRVADLINAWFGACVLGI